MSITFDETDDYYSIPTNSAFSFPDGAWCVGIWVRTLNTATGSAYQYAVSTNNFDARNSFHIYLAENGTSWPGAWFVKGKTDDNLQMTGTAKQITPGGADDGVWRLLIAQREPSDDYLRTYYCPLGGTAANQSTGTVVISDLMDSTLTWYIGRRYDGNAQRYCGSDLAGFFIGDFNLSTDEITAMGNGASIFQLGKIPKVYFPMTEATATMNDWMNGLVATRNSVPTTVAHPPIHTLGKKVHLVGAVSSGILIPQVYHHRLMQGI